MRIWAVAFTRRGSELASHIGAGLREDSNEFELWCPVRLADAVGAHALDGLAAWAKRAFAQADALLFVSACGIATRAIAPLVHDKFTDPAVVCVDEGGSFAVPLLSGHVGGANELARHVASLCDGTAVITTATDVNGTFAVDEWAANQGLAILDREEAKHVSATLLRGEQVGFASDFEMRGALPEGLVGEEEMPRCRTGICVSLDSARRPFEHTLRLVPRTVVLGIGCKRGTNAKSIQALVHKCLAQAHVAPEAVCAVATIDVKADEKGLLEFAREHGWGLRLYSAQQLAAVPGEFASSEFVQRTVGVDNVCERAACAAGASLLLGRQSADGATVAIACANPCLSFEASERARGMARQAKGSVPNARPNSLPCASVVCVGIGPGGADDLTLRVHKALLAADVIVGYTTYVNLVRDAYPHAEFLSTGMRGEVKRCRMALEQAAAGRRVAVVCSGDPGVYGMAGLLLELAPEYPGVRVEVMPGVSAANGGAAVLGAPLMHDWCSISLSDLLTPWSNIEARLKAAVQADFCIVLYNPASRGRADHLRRACDVLLECASEKTVCGIVRNIGREGQACTTLTLGELRDASVDMLTCVFVGNSHTRMVDGRMVTPRGYVG